LTATPFIQQVFGVAVSSGLKAQITNLTSSQISSIFAGTYTDWSKINSGIAAGTAIKICARTPGSGTQASANALFLANPCAPLGQTGFATGANVTLNASTGNLLTCLDTTANSIGIASLADGPRPAAGTFTGDGFAFISIDGHAPSAANAAQGVYSYEVESTINTRLITTYTTPQQNVINALAGIFSDPTSLQTVNSGLPQPAVNALSLNYVPTTPYAASNPVEWGTRGGGTCSPYTLTFP
jgi:ABC-type phosphate transport system substrate-binding protein